MIIQQAEKTSKEIWVVGGGFIGRGIAQVCAQNGHSVCVIDPVGEIAQAARKEMEWSLRRLRKRGEILENPKLVLARVHYQNTPPSHGDIDFMIECVPEVFSVKKVVLSSYDEICSQRTIFASNTSALPIGKLARCTRREDRFIGTHFASPPAMQSLVEMIPGAQTSQETIECTRSLLIGLQREIVEVRVDTAGFVMNRIYLAAAAEAMRLIEGGVAKTTDIDKSMRLGFGWIKGPLEAADFAGLDVIRGAMIAIWDETGNRTYHPPEILSRLVKSGCLGRKSGLGFYEYPKRGQGRNP